MSHYTVVTDLVGGGESWRMLLEEAVSWARLRSRILYTRSPTTTRHVVTSSPTSTPAVVQNRVIFNSN